MEDAAAARDLDALGKQLSQIHNERLQKEATPRPICESRGCMDDEVPEELRVYTADTLYSA